MLKKFGEALFFLFLIWVGWVFIGANPNQRMERACTMVSGPGYFLASLASAANTDWGGAIQIWTNNAAYRCQLTLWNFNYAEEWKKQHPGEPLPGQQGGAPAQAPGSATAGGAPAPARSQAVNLTPPAAPVAAPQPGTPAQGVQ